MLLQYGSVNLNLVDIVSFKREAVYVGKNYAYTRMVLHTRAYFNPGTQNDRYATRSTIGAATGIPVVPPVVVRGGGPGRVPVIGPPTFSPALGPPGVSGIGPIRVPGTVSDEALRHTLMQPRQSLRLSVAGLMSLISPSPGFTMDCMGGPTPIHCDVQKVGPRTWIVDFAVETAVNETFFYKGTGQLPLVLAQMWEQHHSLDEDFFTTRTIEGQVLFRADALAFGGLVPDDFRSQLMVPAPSGFKRLSVDVRVGEQPNLIKYKIVDKQLPFGWSNADITRLSAIHEIKTTKATWGHAFGQHAGEIFNDDLKLWTGVQLATRMAPHLLEHMVPDRLAGLLLKGGAAAAGVPIRAWANFRGMLGLARATPGVVGAAWDAMPVSYHRVMVHAFGNPGSTRSGLEQFARQVINSRLAYFLTGLASLGVAALVPSGVETNIQHNLVGKEIMLDTTFITGPIGAIGSGASSAVVNKSPMPAGDNTSVLITSGGSVPQALFNGTRGNYLGSLASAAYQAMNELPPELEAAPPSQEPPNTGDSFVFGPTFLV